VAPPVAEAVAKPAAKAKTISVSALSDIPDLFLMDTTKKAA